MRVNTVVCTAILAISMSYAESKLHHLSDEFIASINDKQSTWKAGRNFHIDTPKSTLRSLTGTVRRKTPESVLPIKTHQKPKKDVPESFDARDRWPECAEIIGQILDQSSCGSCWAFGTSEVMSDRICIHSRATKKLRVSAEDLMTCCHKCAYDFGCTGGSPDEAFAYWNSTGIVTGGAYGSGEGCKTYFLPPCEHHINRDLPPCVPYVDAPKCAKTCDEDSKLTYSDDLTFGSGYRLHGEENIQLEILENGPVASTYNVYEDFFSYKSGVYQYLTGELIGGHVVKIIGWGVENSTKYWLVANSWNSDWGDKGFFKILRGSDECYIEREIDAGVPTFDD